MCDQPNVSNASNSSLPIAANPRPTTPPDPSIAESDKILCPYCKRTASNGLKCKGICVAENDY